MIDAQLARRLIAAGRRGREWQARRDELIVFAIDQGGTQAEVAKLVGLTQPGVHDIIRRQRSGA